MYNAVYSTLYYYFFNVGNILLCVIYQLTLYGPVLLSGHIHL
jgi:hypothetical protein